MLSVSATQESQLKVLALLELRCCDLSCGDWQLNSGPLQEQVLIIH